jgi:pyruvate,orthophosphate dikinase
MNDEITEALSRRDGLAWTAWDCYRRFLQSWGMAFGVNRDIFDEVMLLHKDRRGVELKIQFAPEHMREIALDYKKVLLDSKIKVENDPLSQLKTAIRCVLDSWSSQASVSVREYMQIADEWERRCWCKR